MADTVTFFPLTGLPLASLSVTVRVMAAVLSATAEVGDAVIVDALTDTAPAVNVTVAVLVRLMLSVILMADIVFASALVDLMTAVVRPFASVGDVGCVMVFPVPVADIVTFFPLIGLLLASSKVMVTVTPVVLSVDTEVGDTVIVDALAETGPAVKVTVTVLVRLMLSVVTVAAMVLASALVDLTLAVV